MNTFFVLLMVGALQPTHPDYKQYLAELGGVPLSHKHEIFDTRDGCEDKRKHYLESALGHHIVVVFHECVPVEVKP